MPKYSYFYSLFIAMSRLLNVLLAFGDVNESLSARAGRLQKQSLFWFCYSKTVNQACSWFGDHHHCEKAYCAYQLSREQAMEPALLDRQIANLLNMHLEKPVHIHWLPSRYNRKLN